MRFSVHKAFNAHLGLADVAQNGSLTAFQEFSPNFMKLISSFFLVASAISATAFTLDFSGLDAALNGNPLFDGSEFVDDKDTIFFGVPGFGNIGFSTDGNPAFLNTTFGTRALEFDDQQVVFVQFISGTTVGNVVPTFVGGGAPVYTVTSDTTGTLTIPAGSAGLASITFDEFGKIPEPSVSILGALGALVLLRRRR